MRKFRIRTALALLTLSVATTWAFAQELGDSVDWSNLGAYFERPETLAVLVFATVGILRKHLFPSGWSDLVGLGVSLAVGLAWGLIGAVTSLSDVSIPAGLALGASGAWIASGGFDALGKLLGKR